MTAKRIGFYSDRLPGRHGGADTADVSRNVSAPAT